MKNHLIALIDIAELMNRGRSYYRTLEYIVKEYGLDEDEVLELKQYVDIASKNVAGLSFMKLKSAERLEAFTEISQQLEIGNSEYKKWSQSFTDEQLADLKNEVLIQIELLKAQA